MHRSVACRAGSTGRTRLAVVGDVHDQWSAKDAAALKALDVDFTLFVGDFGNEKVSVVKEIASIGEPKAVILGNHDAWYTMTARPRSRSPSPPTATVAAAAAAAAAAAEGTPQPPPDRVQHQLDALGDCHIGYSHMQLPNSSISLVGARPFSKGGKSMRTIKDFMARLYNIHDMGESAQRILQIIHNSVPHCNPLIIMGHNGPAGLGGERHNICGVDWVKEAGDHGDPDLAAVLQQLREAGRQVALVVFGHMHHKLQGSGNRQMVHVDDSGCVYLNAATVPRVVPAPRRGPDTPPATRHHFLVIELQNGAVQCAADTWVQVTEADAADSSTSSSSQPDAAQQQAAAADHSSSSSSSSGAGQGLLVAAQQASSSDLQLQLDWRPWAVQGFTVQLLLFASPA
ncbi:hypothetical protein OEZ86_011708 [Tetradesmus obliquus]|nr:hypothetical protein OEZ86_011708 [Tetradesmus obliquus]